MRKKACRPLVLLTVLLGAGCGATTGSGGSVALTAHGNQFNPQGFTAPASGSVSVTVKNEDTVEHNFSVTELGVSHDIEAGKSATFTISTRGDGSLQFFCKYHRTSSHMVGSLTVGSGAGPGSGASSAPASPDAGGGSYGY